MQLWQERDGAKSSSERLVFNRTDICSDGCCGSITFSAREEDADVMCAKSMYGKAMSKKFSYFHLVSGSSHLHDNLIALSFSCGIRA